jgi:hypothetical protein
MFGGDRFEDLIGQISIGTCEPHTSVPNPFDPSPPSMSLTSMTRTRAPWERADPQEKI